MFFFFLSLSLSLCAPHLSLSLSLRFFSFLLFRNKMDSGASFSEPKISMEPLKTVQVREERAWMLLLSHRHPDCDGISLASTPPLAKHDRSCSLARHEQRDALSRKGRRKRAGVQRSSSAEKKKEEGASGRPPPLALLRQGSHSFSPPAFARPLPIRVPLSSFAKKSTVVHCSSCWERRERESKAQGFELGMRRKQNRTTGDDALVDPSLFSTSSSSTRPPLLSLTNKQNIVDRDVTAPKPMNPNRPARPLSRPHRRPSASPTSWESRTGSSPSRCPRPSWPSRSWRSRKGPCRCTRSPGRTRRRKDLVWLFSFTEKREC